MSWKCMLVAVTALLAGCAAQPQSNTLEGALSNVRHDAYVRCLRTMHGANRNVPVFDLQRACRAWSDQR